jgi:hypothetical protein
MMMDLDEKGMDAQEHEETVCYVLWHVILSFVVVRPFFMSWMVGKRTQGRICNIFIW